MLSSIGLTHLTRLMNKDRICQLGLGLVQQGLENRGLVKLSLVAVLCAGVMVCAPGCKVVQFFFPADEIELASNDTGGIESPSSIESSSSRGLEILLWVVDDTDWTAARLLSPYLDRSQQAGISPVSESDESRWADWGFRLVAVPIEDVDKVLEQLSPVQPINVQWLGEFGQWRAVVRAGELRTSHVRVGQRAIAIEQGRPRMIARSWVEPILTETDVIPGVRLDLSMQIESKSAGRNGGFFDPQRERMIEDDGPVIDELIYSHVLDGTRAIVIVGDAPDARWDELPEPASALSDGSKPPTLSGGFGPDESKDDSVSEGDQDQGVQEPRDRSSAQARGSRSGGVEPIKPLGKTLGELMLTSSGSRIVRANQTRTVPKRVIVVLVPRVDGTFTLIPRSGVQQTQSQGKN